MAELEPPVFDTDPGYDGWPVYTPQEPGAPPADPIPVSPGSPSPLPPVSPVPVAPVPLPTPTRAPTALPVPRLDGAARYSRDDYAAAALALMPRGLAWNAEPGSVQAQLLRALVAVLEQNDAAASGILAGSLPGLSTPLLPEWEATLGLPDPCAGDAPTIAQRLDQVRGRFVNAGGQSRERYIEYAAALGFTITITNYAPFRAGRSTAGNPCSSDAWTFLWGVTVVATTGTLPVEVLHCELEAVKPAETTILII